MSKTIEQQADDGPGVKNLREALYRERDLRHEAEIEVGRLRVELQRDAWQAAFWRAGILHTKGTEVVGPMLDPAFLRDPASLRAEVARFTAELIGLRVETSGESLTEIAVRMETTA